jgi:4-carboxymuconolactone decarboxylase
MSRLSEVDPNTSPDIAEAFRHTTASRGFVSNLMRLMAHSPETLKAHGTYGHHLRFHSDLTELQRELVICATVRGVRYGWVHHGGLLKQLGMTDEQMDTLHAGKVPPGLSTADSALCVFSFAYASCQGVPDAVLAAVRKHFSDRQMIDIALLSAYFLGAGSLIAAFQPELETPAQLQLELDWQKKRLNGKV